MQNNLLCRMVVVTMTLLVLMIGAVFATSIAAAELAKESHTDESGMQLVNCSVKFSNSRSPTLPH